ncbi:unnamed protein product [Lactuca virosa]|uniref:Bet v I/Major latex protein domain-containing protein n=1 Tax=Lactuca virosa TaxID=75947 RepID=A0AAU9NV35_9ASTR|nr:unnamed protein product [Lactuca virosa]
MVFSSSGNVENSDFHLVLSELTRVSDVSRRRYTPLLVRLSLFSSIAGMGISDKVEKVSYDIKFEATPDNGTISKMTSTIYTHGDFELEEEELNAGKEKVLGLYKVVEAYLLENPDAYV